MRHSKPKKPKFSPGERQALVTQIVDAYADLLSRRVAGNLAGYNDANLEKMLHSLRASSENTPTPHVP